jgi:hypothetical protein
MHNNEVHQKSIGTIDATDDFARFLRQEGLRELPPLSRAPVQGPLKWAFWGLRLYIVVMLMLVAIGFTRGMH